MQSSRNVAEQQHSTHSTLIRCIYSIAFFVVLVVALSHLLWRREQKNTKNLCKCRKSLAPSNHLSTQRISVVSMAKRQFAHSPPPSLPLTPSPSHRAVGQQPTINERQIPNLCFVKLNSLENGKINFRWSEHHVTERCQTDFKIECNKLQPEQNENRQKRSAQRKTLH